MQLFLVVSEVVKPALLSNSPYKVLKEVTSEKEAIRLYLCGMNEEAVVVVFSQGDMFALLWAILLKIVIEDPGIPTYLASWIKEDSIGRDKGGENQGYAAGVHHGGDTG
jgi:hypothetical protein